MIKRWFTNWRVTAVAAFFIFLLWAMLGCASTGGQTTHDWCKEAGGVWYKGALDSEYRCVDKKSLEDQLNSIFRRMG